MARTPDDQRLELLQGTTAAATARLLREQNRRSRLVRAIGRLMNPAPEGKK